MKKIIAVLFFISPFWASGQKSMVLEQLRCYNEDIPVSNYLGDPDIQRTIAGQLSRTMQKFRQMALSDTSRLNVQFLNYYSVAPGISPAFNSADSSSLHLYLDFLEIDPFYFFRNSKNKGDTLLAAKAKTMFSLEAWILNGNKRLMFTTQLYVVVTDAETPGMGLLYDNGIHVNDLAVLPKTFTEMLRASCDLMFNTKSEMAAVELKLQPAFLFNAAFARLVSGQARIMARTDKNISTYRMQDSREMIRMGPAIYDQIILKGNRAQVLPADLSRTIRFSDHFAKSDFVFLKQEGRDVSRDKNYLLQLVVQVDPDNLPREEKLLFTNFLKGNFHYLFREQDTLAVFSIQKPMERSEPVYVSPLFNGYDSGSIYRLGSSYKRPMWQPGYDYIIEGRFNNQDLTIKCGGKNTLREIYLGGKLVCIAQGRFSIEKFVVFDASLSPETLNALFLIAFNRFLE